MLRPTATGLGENALREGGRRGCAAACEGHIVKVEVCPFAWCVGTSSIDPEIRNTGCVCLPGKVKRAIGCPGGGGSECALQSPGCSICAVVHRIVIGSIRFALGVELQVDLRIFAGVDRKLDKGKGAVFNRTSIRPAICKHGRRSRTARCRIRLRRDWIRAPSRPR